LERLENLRLENYPIFLPLKQPLLALSRNICISGNPFRILDRCKSEGFLLDARERKESRLCLTEPILNSFHSTIFLYTMHLSRPQYLDFASKFSSWFDTIIVLLHLLKTHLVRSSVKEHLRGLKRNAVCYEKIYIYIYTKLSIRYNDNVVMLAPRIFFSFPYSLSFYFSLWYYI